MSPARVTLNNASKRVTAAIGGKLRQPPVRGAPPTSKHSPSRFLLTRQPTHRASVWRYLYGAPADDAASSKAPPSPPPPRSIDAPSPPPAKLAPAQPATIAAVRTAVRADTTTEHLLASTGEPLDDLAIRRWLHACGGDVAEAATSLQRHAAWRAGAAPGGHVPPSAFADVASVPKICLQGLDTRGRPVLVLKAALHSRGHAAANAALVCCALDAAERLTRRHPHPSNPEHRILVLFDLARVRPSNCDIRALASIFDTLKRHYPERLDALLFLNAPPLFGGLYSLISPMVVEGVRRKISFVPRGARGVARALAPLLPPSVWPVCLGGTAPEVPVQAAVAAGAAPRGVLRAGLVAAARGTAALRRLLPRPPAALAGAAAVLAAVAALAVAALASALRWVVWGQGLAAGGAPALDGKPAKWHAWHAAGVAPPPPVKGATAAPAGGADEGCKKSAATAWSDAEAAAAVAALTAFGPPPSAGLDLLWPAGTAPL